MIEMEAFGGTGSLIFIIQISLDVADLGARHFMRSYQLCKLYGIPGILLSVFGNHTTWRIQAQILGKLNDEDALAFKASVYNECTMIAVAAAIVAQIAITGLSLNNLSQTHWVAKGSFVLSMTFALMAVYYATTQQRTLGRLIKAKDVRLWIRGGNRQSEVGRLVPSLHDIVIKFRGYLQARFDIASEQPREGPRVQISIFSLFWLPSAIWEDQIRADRQPRSTLQLRFDFVSSDPDDFTPDLSNIKDVKGSIMYHCFTPSVASVVTISAPQMLLSSSLALVLIALGIYFCSVWTLNLDQTVEPNDNRKVFITYLVGLGIAGLAYSISQLFQNDDKRSERQIVEGYLDEYLASHPEAVARWGLDSTHIDNGISLAQIEREGRLHDAEAQHSQRPLVEE